MKKIMNQEKRQRRPLISREEAANYLGVKPHTLAVWKSEGRYNIPVVKVGRKCMYDVDELDRFRDSNTITFGDQ